MIFEPLLDFFRGKAITIPPMDGPLRPNTALDEAAVVRQAAAPDNLCFDGKQILRAGLEDHLCGRLLGLPMGVDVCYTNHAEADQNDMDILLTTLGVAGCPFVITVPGADDVMLGYQSLSFHDAHYIRDVLGLRPAPEFESWLDRIGLLDACGHVLEASPGRFPIAELGIGTPR